MATAQRGRPREFDRSAALDRALTLFWERGYEATSIADLTMAMGVGPPSLYAAFGSKRELFEEVLTRYAKEHRAFMATSLLEEPTLRAGLERMLREAATAYTLPDRPRGCLVISAATNCSSPEVQERLRDLRNSSVDQFERLIRAAIAAGELRDGAEPRVLALATSVLMQGMAQQARDGATREELEATAMLTVAAWPWRTRRSAAPRAGSARRRSAAQP
jgi:TetR/AcrR family transcriptional regulator, copper-responsive repressor